LEAQNGSTDVSAGSRLSDEESEGLQEIVNSVAIAASQQPQLYPLYHRLLDFQARLLGQQV
jgi:hypothetical protein